MRAIRVERPGGPEVLVPADVPLPEPGEGEIRVRHAAVGLNYIDVYHRTGLYPLPMPTGLGLEAAGTVEAVGPGVARFKLGDRVAYCSGPAGAYAEAHVVPAGRAVAVPDGVSLETAAAALLKGLTAEYLVRRTFHVKPGHTVVIHSAAGGVGLILTQWAKAIGAVVIGTVGSQAKAEIAAAHGCDHVLIYGDDRWAEEVRRLTGGRGAEVVYDGVGQATFDASLSCLAPRGMMVSYGNASGPVPEIAPLKLGQASLFLTRPRLFDYVATTEELDEAALALFGMIASGAVKIEIGARFPLDQAAEAHRALEARRTIGSTLLIP